jgi:hypothetical protein
MPTVAAPIAAAVAMATGDQEMRSSENLFVT